MIGVQCKNKMIMIDEHIPKHPVSDSKVKWRVKQKKKKKMKALGGKHDKLIEWKHNPRWQDKGDLTDTQTQPISEHSQLETKKREYWIRTVTKEALKALRCTHV